MDDSTDEVGPTVGEIVTTDPILLRAFEELLVVQKTLEKVSEEMDELRESIPNFRFNPVVYFMFGFVTALLLVVIVAGVFG